MESSPKTISFAKNGTMFGTAFELDSNIKDKPLYPHVATKNVQISVNFGNPVWCETPDSEGYLPLQDAKEDEKVRAAKPPENVSECEVIMMVGLPASGKTTWARKYCAQNRDKRCTILSELWEGCCGEVTILTFMNTRTLITFTYFPMKCQNVALEISSLVIRYWHFLLATYCKNGERSLFM